MFKKIKKILGFDNTRLNEYKSQMNEKNIDYYTNLYNVNIRNIDSKPISSLNKKILEISKTKFNHVMDAFNSSGGYPWNDTPNPNTEYVNTIFLSIFKRGHRNPEILDSYPRWTSYELNIKNPVAKFQQLFNEGYIKTAPYFSILERIPTVRLKEILSENGVISKERKASAIHEIIKQNLTEEQLSKYIPQYYNLTDKGVDFINKNSAYFEIRELKKYEIKSFEYFKMRDEYPQELSVNEVAWEILNDRYKCFQLYKNSGFARNELLYMSQYMEDKKNYAESLKFYIKVMYYDLHGFQTSKLPQTICTYNEEKGENEGFLAPGIVDKIANYKQEYLESMVTQCFKDIPFPDIKFTEAEYKEFLQKIFSGEISCPKSNYELKIENLKNELLSQLKNNKGILQSELLKQFDSSSQSYIKTMISELLQKDKLTREKSRRAFKLYIKE